jgi:hypothetical protein
MNKLKKNKNKENYYHYYCRPHYTGTGAGTGPGAVDHRTVPVTMPVPVLHIPVSYDISGTGTCAQLYNLQNKGINLY